MSRFLTEEGERAIGINQKRERTGHIQKPAIQMSLKVMKKDKEL